MMPFNKAFAILAVASLGLWGCAEGPTNRAANAERTKALEACNAKLEQDYRAAASNRDQLKKKLATAEAERVLVQQELEQLKQAAKERDQLRQEVKVRLGEREAVQNQFDQFRKGIRELLGQMDAAAAPTTGQPLTSVNPAVIAPKS
jgi:septal ring factor EnvC (AmiA/AmiB activator)